MSSLLLLSASEPSSFRPLSKFEGASEQHLAPPVADDGLMDVAPEEEIFARGFAEGEIAANGKWEAVLLEREKQFTSLVSNLDWALRADTEALAQCLYQAVLSLCEHAILPLAIDPEGLANRARTAAELLRRKTDERVVRLHPDDAILVAPLLSPDLTVLADSAIERGSLRIDTDEGGIEDGPRLWRQRLDEALGTC